MKSIRVQVLKSDIEADSHKADSCPIATAIGRYGLQAAVTHKTIRIYDCVPMGWGHKKVCRDYHLPPLIQDWIAEYDSRTNPLPIEFELNLDTPFNVKEIAYVSNP